MKTIQSMQFQSKPKNKETRMKTVIQMKFKNSDAQTNIDKYRVAANFTYYIKINLP